MPSKPSNPDTVSDARALDSVDRVGSKCTGSSPPLSPPEMLEYPDGDESQGLAPTSSNVRLSTEQAEKPSGVEVWGGEIIFVQSTSSRRWPLADLADFRASDMIDAVPLDAK